MTSSRSSKVATLALLLVLSLAAVAPAAAVNVANEDVPEEAEVGTTVEATFTIDTLYQEPNFNAWTLQGETEMNNVTWTVAYKNPSGSTFAQRQYNGQTFSQNGIDAESGTDPFGSPITEIEVTVRGEAPAVEEFTFPEKETFLVAEFTQQAGDSGSTNDVGSWSGHHYTTGGEDEAGSQQARTAIAQAQGAIQSADEAGADVTEANRSLNNAIEFYESGNFDNAIENANTAQQQATEAENQAESSAQTTQLLIYGGIGVLVVVLIGGGYWYYQQQQDDYDKLG